MDQNIIVGIVVDTSDDTGSGKILINIPTHMEYSASDASEIKVKINKEVFSNPEDVPDDEITLTNYIECRPLRSDDSKGSGSSTFKPQVGQKVQVILVGENEYYYQQMNFGTVSDNRSKNHNIGRTSLTSSFKAALGNSTANQDVNIISSNGNYAAMGMTDKDGLGSMALSTGSMEVVLGEIPASNFAGFALVGAASSYYMNPAYGQFSSSYADEKYTWKMYAPDSTSSLSLKSPPAGFEKNKIIEKSKLPYEGTFTTVKLKKKSHTEEVETTHEIKSDKEHLTAKTEVLIDGGPKVEMKGKNTTISGDTITLKAENQILLEVGSAKFTLSSSGGDLQPMFNVG